ncbi:hypothetical protein SAMN05421820_103787 [Pedobacter steynii]|uniref:Uncharacterized protein n=1 Tax=Pedobacter steynii TaxID=430522 RepID=A0A1G9T458_9SPHI|nr:hypothetical protein [Pedobacter steynii]NQX37245.1 hypothetical protein [Pedobacter steynii]SDM42416.1 hypothetical protein SAMN05421820_103787 [Pedobacter steynii]
MRYHHLLCGFLLLLCYSCGDSTVAGQKNAHIYFDLKGYIEQESNRLNRSNPSVHKTVMVNDSSESKEIKIKDWKKELSAFSDADMNRAAWKGLFQVKKSGEKEMYTSDHKKVPVKELIITRRSGQLYGLQLFIRNSNTLYTSADTLSYYPDSLYEVKKTQNIRLLSTKNYRITGKFK